MFQQSFYSLKGEEDAYELDDRQVPSILTKTIELMKLLSHENTQKSTIFVLLE